MNRAPRVSVIVIAFNREAMIGDAIASVLAQNMPDFELIVVDDGSTDRTVGVVEGIRDPRIRLIVHEKNRGIPAARNSGLEAAAGRYIAWLDSDDLARRDRLAIQADYLDTHPSIALVGARSGLIKPNGRRSRIPRSRPRRHEQIVAMLLFRTPLLQSSFMGRAEILKRYPYRLEFPVSEDLDMLIRLTRDYRIENLKETLVDRRAHSEQIVRRSLGPIAERKRVLFRESLARLGFDPSDDELDRHITLGRIRDAEVDRAFLDWSGRWLEGIVAANRSHRIYDPAGLAHAVRWVWWRACAAALRGPDRPRGAVGFLKRPWS
jgi:hypothetical protein